MSLRPEVTPHARMTVDTSGPELSYSLRTLLTAQPIEVPPTIGGLLLLCDGQHSVGQLYDRVDSWGLGFPGKAYLQSWLDVFEQVGAIRYRGYQLRSLGRNRYRCEGCGFSCRGPEVPLPDLDAARLLQSQWEQLCDDHPLLVEKPPLREEPGGLTYLTRYGGECPFLDADARCLIHARFGAEAKPLACQVFPLVAITVEDELRLAYSGSCMSLHQTFDQASPQNLPGWWKTIDQRVAPVNMSRPPEPKPPLPTNRAGDPARQFADAERRILAWLKKSSPTLQELAATAALGRPPKRRKPELPSPVLLELRMRLKSWAQSIVDGSAWPLKVSSEGAFAEELRILVGDLVRTDLTPDMLRPLPPRWSSYLRYRLNNLLWLRRGLYLGPLPHTLLLYFYGAAAALWSGRSAGRSADEAYHRFGRGLVIWDMAVHHPQDVDRLFDRGVRDLLLEQWQSLFADAGWVN